LPRRLCAQARLDLNQPLAIESVLDRRNAMTRLGLIALSTLSLAFIMPATAQETHQGTHRGKSTARIAATNVDPSLPVENALRWGYSQGYSNYPSGWGGLYGDGRYPGNVISNSSPRNSRP
jgi:hypothetical protein